MREIDHDKVDRILDRGERKIAELRNLIRQYDDSGSMRPSEEQRALALAASARRDITSAKKMLADA